MENQEEKKEIKGFEHDGRKYTFVHPGARWYLQALDKSKNANGVLMQEKYIATLLNCCVAPKITIEEFENDLPKLLEVTREIESFLGA
jgi:hypothetical protein